MSMVIERTHDQRLAALERANRIRQCRAALKRHLHAGTADPVAVLADPADEIAGMKVFDLLCAIKQYGPAKVNPIMRVVRISPAKTIGGLSDRQRLELVDELGVRLRRAKRAAA